jgi:hypothetical protein
LTLADYNIQIQHHPRPQNQADALFQRPDYNQGKKDNYNIIPLPTNLFKEDIQSVALNTLIMEEHKKEDTSFKE